MIFVICLLNNFALNICSAKCKQFLSWHKILLISKPFLILQLYYSKREYPSGQRGSTQDRFAQAFAGSTPASRTLPSHFFQYYEGLYRRLVMGAHHYRRNVPDVCHPTRQALPSAPYGDPPSKRICGRLFQHSIRGRIGFLIPQFPILRRDSLKSLNETTTLLCFQLAGQSDGGGIGINFISAITSDFVKSTAVLQSAAGDYEESPAFSSRSPTSRVSTGRLVSSTPQTTSSEMVAYP